MPDKIIITIIMLVWKIVHLGGSSRHNLGKTNYSFKTENHAHEVYNIIFIINLQSITILNMTYMYPYPLTVRFASLVGL
jgi:hypothetical protein